MKNAQRSMLNAHEVRLEIFFQYSCCCLATLRSLGSILGLSSHFVSFEAVFNEATD